MNKRELRAYFAGKCFMLYYLIMEHGLDSIPMEVLDSVAEQSAYTIGIQ